VAHYTKKIMKLLHCTQKLFKKLPEPLKKVDDLAPIEITQGIGNWYANIFIANRKTHLLFTNEKTLYSFVIPEVRKKTFQNLSYAFIWHLELHLEYEKINKTAIKKILSEHDSFIITKTNNKSVLGCMRYITYHFQHDFYKYPEMDEEKLFAVTKKNNGVPHKIKDYVFSIDLLRDFVKKKYS